jgi:polar amino acid transport system permease protein
MMTFTDWDILRNLLLAARWTLLLSLVAFFGGTVVTIPLVLMRLTRRRWMANVVRVYVEIFQGTPLLMQLFLAFFGLGLFGINVSPWTAAAFALTFYSSAYLADIWSGSIEALPKGQWEACRCLGLSFGQTLWRVIAPQALRIAVAPTKAGTMLNNVTYEPFKVFGLVACGYFLMCYPLSLYSHYLERTLLGDKK